jgi:hypothetical protein
MTLDGGCSKKLRLPARTARTATAATAMAASTLTTVVAVPPASGLGPRFIHVHSSAAQFCAVQLRNSVLCSLRISHFNKGKTARLAGSTVSHDIDSFYSAIRLKGGLQVFLSCLVAEISDKNVGHNIESFK